MMFYTNVLYTYDTKLGDTNSCNLYIRRNIFVNTSHLQIQIVNKSKMSISEFEIIYIHIRIYG